MRQTERVPIMRTERATLYGRVIDNKGKLGRYEVHSPSLGMGGPYATFKEAENVYKAADSEKDSSDNHQRKQQSQRLQ